MKAEQNELSEKIDVIIYLLQQSLDAQKAVVEWIGYDECKEFFDYGSTQMASLIKTERLVVAQIGRRKFISRKSLLSLLERNVLRHH
ncbi:MAG: hypothetical protein JSS82_14360 [Bacteroidetes bacterium]|nr:hypothetical protein [Bacteroidota bacterium]